MAARVHVTDTYDVPDTDDADADTDDDAGPCEDIVVLAKTHSGASEDTYCGSDDDDDDDAAGDDHDGDDEDDDDDIYINIYTLGSTLWGSTLSGNGFWIWTRTCLSLRRVIEDPST